MQHNCFALLISNYVCVCVGPILRNSFIAGAAMSRHMILYL